MVLARNAFLRKRAAVLRIQAAYRGHTARSVAADLRCDALGSLSLPVSVFCGSYGNSEAAVVRLSIPHVALALFRQWHVLSM